MEIPIFLLMILFHLVYLLLGPLSSHSPDPQLDTVVECGDLARLQDDRSSRKLGLH